ncbi:DUF3325 domain-containing protein [Burkholderia multivorans]|uniref:DUF3325 domain-containing protein n=1 Tax=Burkholderia multivorans TaxID=87883 RepID=UPI0015883CD8|nr:DUF3325 domain-containing protein [Burkholderia multivorans]
MGLSFTLALLGFAALALAMRSHYRELFGVDCSRRRSGFLRGAGVVLLAASYNCLRVVWGVVEGAIDWLCLASMAAIVIVFLLGIAILLRSRQLRGGGHQGSGAASDAPTRAPAPDGETM